MRIKDWATKLIFATFMVMVVRYVGAFVYSDMGKVTGTASDVLSFFVGLSGFGMAILDVVGGGLLFNGWRLTFPRAGQRWTFRFWVLTFCVFGLITSSLIVLVPFTIARITQESIVDALGGRQAFMVDVWATMVNVVPYLLIDGVFVGNRMVEQLEVSAGTTGTGTASSAGSSGTFGTRGTRNRMPRVSQHQMQVSQLMTDVFQQEGRYATFLEVMNQCGLPKSTASRLRNQWIEAFENQNQGSQQ